jgi:hypothetical protein
VELSNVESCSGPTVMACSDEERCDMVAAGETGLRKEHRGRR